MPSKRRTVTTSSPTRAVGYVRVSTEKQAADGGSLAAQRERLEQYAALYRLELVEVIEDAGESGGKLNRPGLQRALAMLEDGHADALLVVKMDRLTRSLKDLSHLLEHYFATRFALLSVAEQFDTRSAGGRLVINVLGAVSQWEREAIGERTAAVMQHMKRQGEFTGGASAPYGYMLDESGTRVVPYEREQRVIGEARSLRGRGLSLRAVSRALTERGFAGRLRRTFSAEQVARMVQA